jgi:aspartate kinase
MKFGGTSVADAERIKRAAQRIVTAKEAGMNVVAVLSARGKHTDELVALAHEVSDAAAPARDGHAALDRRARDRARSRRW